MSSSHMFWMRTTLFHSSQHDLARPVILPGTRQCLANLQKNLQVAGLLPTAAEGCNRLIKQKPPDRVN